MTLKVYKTDDDYTNAEVIAEYDEEAEEFVSGGEEVLGMLGAEEVTARELWESFDGPRVFVGEDDPEDEKSFVDQLASLLGR